jgi:hypothetical protein
MKHFYTLLFLVLPIIAFSQDTSSLNRSFFTDDNEENISKGDFLLALSVGVPSEAMKPAIKNNMGDLGFGISFLYVSNPFTWGRNKSNSPFRIGGEAGYTYYGRFLTDVKINGYDGSFKTSYGILHLNAILRFRPAETQKFTPFADVFGGGNFYLSNTKENLNAIESALGIEELDLGGTSSSSLVRGVGAGFIIGKSADPQKGKLTVRTTYSWGKRIKYIERNSLSYNSSTRELNYIEGRAPLRYFLIQVGLGL